MENNKKITVFGATGKIGEQLLKHLSDAKINCIAVTRNKNKIKVMPFVEWVEADLSDKESLYQTMVPGGSVFLLSGHSNNFVNEQHHAIEVAKERGVAHMVKLSSAAADKDSPFHIANVHGKVEELLENSGLSYTILRPNGFMQNWLGELAQTVKQERKIYEATGNGKRAYIDLRDIAEVAFAVLTRPSVHDHKIYFLTGDEAVNYTQVAKLMSDAIHEKVDFIQLSMDEAQNRMEQKGIPVFIIKALLAYAEDQRNGKTEMVSAHVRQILQKPARTPEAFIQEHAAFFS